jgi:hypothetical protein
MYGHSRPQQQYYTPNTSSARPSGGHYRDGSHSYQPQYGPPPGTDPQLWQYFASVDTDRSGSIDVNELQSALVNGTAFKKI